MFDITLDKRTAHEIYAIADVCLKSRTIDNFLRNVFGQVQHILGQEMAACGVMEIDTAKIVSMLNAGFPPEFIASIVDANACFQSPLYRRWLRFQTPQAAEFGDCKNGFSADELKPYKIFRISNVLAHGMIDLDHRHVTYFGFSQIQRRIEPHHFYLMSFMIPHLHVAYRRILNAEQDSSVPAALKERSTSLFFLSQASTDDNSKPKGPGCLSPRELEVLRWLLNGKSNWDIGKILHISEYTVKNHVQRILKKLNASSRQHAVAKALESGIIQL